jgi:hypothetical protein
VLCHALPDWTRPGLCIVGPVSSQWTVCLFCYWCSGEIGLPQTELARELEMTVSGIGYAVRRGEIVAAREGYTLIDSVI